MSFLLFGISISNFLVTAIFYGLVAHHYQDFFTMNSQNLDPTGNFWAVWILIMVSISLAFFLAFVAVAVHMIRMCRLFAIPVKRFVILDIGIAISATIGCLAFAIYFYVTIQPYGQMNFSGAEIVFGVVTILLSLFSVIVTLRTPDYMFSVPMRYPVPELTPPQYHQNPACPTEIKVEP